MPSSDINKSSHHACQRDRKTKPNDDFEKVSKQFQLAKMTHTMCLSGTNPQIFHRYAQKENETATRKEKLSSPGLLKNLSLFPYFSFAINSRRLDRSLSREWKKGGRRRNADFCHSDRLNTKRAPSDPRPINYTRNSLAIYVSRFVRVHLASEAKKWP